MYDIHEVGGRGERLMLLQLPLGGAGSDEQGAWSAATICLSVRPLAP